MVKEAFDGANKNAADYGLLPSLPPAMERDTIEPKRVAEARDAAFFEAIGAEIISVDSVRASGLIRLYFTPAPPFSPTGKKKNEFPDAIALLSLEAWALEYDKRVLAVTGDSDWAAYAHKCSSIDVVKELGEALALLQQHTKEASATINSILTDIEQGKIPGLISDLERKIGEEVEAYSIDAHADAAYDVEIDEVYLSMIGFDLTAVAGKYNFEIVQNNSGSIVARVPVEVRVNASASFSLSVYDSIDKDSVPMGRIEAQKEITLDCSVLIAFEGDHTSGELELGDVTLVDAPAAVDFGWVEPDYGEDYND